MKNIDKVVVKPIKEQEGSVTRTEIKSKINI